MDLESAPQALSITDRVLGNPVVSGLSAKSTSSRPRIIAYHDVPDRSAFRRHLEHLVDRYTPVTGAQVASTIAGGASLPRNAVWVTFDDGRRSVVETALPELDRLGVGATMFVCPGLFEPGASYWWSVVQAALVAGGPFELDGRVHRDRSLVTALKQVPDARRRSIVDELQARLDQPLPREAVTAEQVLQWRDAGLEVGNHTLDHPCLHQCEPDEQRRQILDAHGALTDLLGEPPALFAYPNGDRTPSAERILAGAGYSVAPLFDHHLVARSPNRFELSRLRLDADAPEPRMRAVLSGGHSGMFHLREQVRGLRTRVKRNSSVARSHDDDAAAAAM